MLRQARVETQTAMEESTLTLLREVHHTRLISTMVMTSIVEDTCLLKIVPVELADKEVKVVTLMFTQWMLTTR